MNYRRATFQKGRNNKGQMIFLGKKSISYEGNEITDILEMITLWLAVDR
jgi:hypothetical protein